MTRLTKDDWAMSMALTTAKRSTCLRRQVGCVLLNERGHVLATGYNGVAMGLPHCNEVTEVPIHSPPRTQTWNGETNEVRDCVGFNRVYAHACPGAGAKSGTDLDACGAIHAEQNALLQCHDVHEIHTAYITTSPCMTCTKLLLNTTCERIVFLESYAHADAARRLWEKASRQWILADS